MTSVLIISLLITKLASTMMYAGNIFLHSILKESKRLPKMKKFLFKHALDQEMSFYDEKTVGDIKSAMDPMAIVDIISWRVPFLVAEIFKLLFIIHNMILMNWQLTVSSLAFLGLFKLLLHPIEKVMPCGRISYFEKCCFRNLSCCTK